MTFDSNRAWQDATAAVRANREVLLALAGVFFLLPTMLSTMFLSGLQTRVLENMNKTEALNQLLKDNMGAIVGFGFGGLLVQMVGFIAVMALLGDRRRPTVGQAIARGLRGLPTLIVIGILVFLGTTTAGTVLANLLVLVAGAAAGGLVAVAALLALFGYVVVKLSLVLPVVVNERTFNPVGAAVRSWRLTRGSALRLFGFYVMMAICYLVIAMVASFIVLGPVLLLLGQGEGSLLAIGLISGLIAGAASVILTAVLAQAHRQLAGPTPKEIARF